MSKKNVFREEPSSEIFWNSYCTRIPRQNLLSVSLACSVYHICFLVVARISQFYSSRFSGSCKGRVMISEGTRNIKMKRNGS